MSGPLAKLRESRGWWFGVALFCVGLTLFGFQLSEAIRDRDQSPGFYFSAAFMVALIVLVSRVPMVIDPGGGGGVEVGFDSSILMFALCTLDIHDALAIWGAGIILTQVASRKRLASQVFNVGVGILAGSTAAAALSATRGGTIGTPRELGAVACAAAAYFATDFLLSAVSVSISTGSPFHELVWEWGTLISLAGVVTFDTLGYLGAVVQRSTPWAVSLLIVPLSTLLVATYALNRGREQGRRLTTLFAAAQRAQFLRSPHEVESALITDAQRLLLLPEVTLRSTFPGVREIGARVQRGDDSIWIIAEARGRARSSAAADEEGLKALAAVASDAFARLKLTDGMLHAARHDPLTDLPNRGILLDRVTEMLVRAGQRSTEIALIFLDLDGFKPVNDRFGHDVGDGVLIELAARLRSCTREVDTVARLGGDEFAVLVRRVEASHVELVAERLLDAIRQPLNVAGRQLSLSASIGIAFAGPGDNAAELLRKADLAMYVSKAGGKDQLVVYSDAVGRSRVERLEIADDLRRAIKNSEIEVAYQPIVDITTGQIVGAEALARWSRNGAPVPPDVFVQLAEETGLIVELGERVMSRVVHDMAPLRNLTGQRFKANINISPQQLREPSLISNIRDAVITLEGIDLILEITEREGIETDLEMIASMHAICAIGAEFAIDDFGVGFSSISYLHDLPATFIKADSSLSHSIDTDTRARALLQSVMLMGATMGLTVIVEGIERETQLDVLKCADATAPNLGVVTAGPFAQGYLLHRPMPIEDLVSLVLSSRTARPVSESLS